MAARLRTAVAVLAAVCFLAGPVGAESGVKLPYPPAFETLDAATYDLSGSRVGGAHLVVERIENGNVRMLSKTGFEEGARTVLSAELAPIEVDGRRGLQPVWQESRSFDPDGTARGRLRIDHVKRVASCRDTSTEIPTELRLELPDGDRVVNVPLNLLFLPLARGEKDQVSFQFFLCGGGPRLLDFQARVARRAGQNGSRRVEIQYGPDFGTFGSLLLAPVLPRLSMWLDPAARQPWLGHRVPLYAKGPEVLVVRDGIPLEWLEEEEN